MFVGMLDNTSAIAAVSIVFPIFMLISALGQMFGVGSASYISRLLGEKNKLQADKTTSTTFFTSIFCGIIFTILGAIYLEPLLRLFGTTETIMPYAKDYARILIYGSLFTILNMTMNNMIRAEGNAKYSMLAISLGALINIILVPIMILILNLIYYYIYFQFLNNIYKLYLHIYYKLRCLMYFKYQKRTKRI